MSTFSGLLDDVRSVPQECRWTHPAGFSNFLARYYIPYLWAKELRLPFGPHERVVAAFEDKRWTEKVEGRYITDYFGSRGRVLAGRGITQLPDCGTKGFKEQLTMGDWRRDKAGGFVSYSLNVTKSAVDFAQRRRKGPHSKKCSGLAISWLAHDDVQSWGSDSESGFLNEAEVWANRDPRHIKGGFVLSDKKLPFRKLTKDERRHYGLGYYVLAYATQEQGETLLELPTEYGFSMGRRLDVTLLHPEISAESRYYLKHAQLQLKDGEIQDSRDWYEVRF
jgi:hypothetical protein